MTQPTRSERAFLLLTIYVLARQNYIGRASRLAEAMHAAGDGSPEVLLARAVLASLEGKPQAVLGFLDQLDRLDPVERFGTYALTERQRARRLLRAQALSATGARAAAREAAELYLRHPASVAVAERRDLQNL